MLYLGADHNGFWLKEELKEYLKRRGVPCFDVGSAKHIKEDDYPVYAARVSRKLGPYDLGLLICGSGHGMAIAANKIRGIRAALASSVFSARKAREDDHANVLVLSSWETTVERAKRIVASWLVMKPSKAFRHVRRISMIKRLER